MTYLNFLLVFIVPAVALAALVTYWDARAARRLPSALRARGAGAVLLAHVLVALLYTTPWDNYLVATRVWWYNPQLVLGITLGWVPLEEYAFFILQTAMTGWLLLALHRRLPAAPALPVRAAAALRAAASGIAGALWMAALWPLAGGWRPGIYLALVLVWALPPIALQLAVGADVLWQQRRAVGSALLAATLYLAAADFRAIGSGTWTIDPAQSLGWFIAGTLPVEELIFFFLTNTLVVFGITLVISRRMNQRAQALLDAWRNARQPA